MSATDLAVESAIRDLETTPAPKPSLHRAPLELRALKSGILTGLTWIAALLASVPLFSVIYELVVAGGSRLNGETLTALPPSAFDLGGGFGNAIIGTGVMVGIATLISVPIGILAAVYLAILDPDSKLAHTVRFLAKVLTGFPSILAGVFVYAVMVVTMKTYSALAGGVALAVLMLPTVMLTAEQAVRMVPQRMKDAAFGMGCTRDPGRIWKVVLPTAMPGILTGVMLAIAGAAGNSAPLLFTALFSDYWLRSLTEPTASLAILIFNFSGMPYENQIQLAWAASLVLVLIVLVFNVLSRLVGGRQGVRMEVIDMHARPETMAACRARETRRQTAIAIDCQAREDLLRQVPRGPRRPRAHREEQDHRLHRPLGLRQEHRAAQPQPDERPDPDFPLQGKVSYHGQDIYDKKVDPVVVRRYIGMVFQQPNPFSMSIYDNVAFGLRLNGFKGNLDERVEKALQGAACWNEVKDKLKNSGLSLSGGQQQRLCIARAIATEPDVLLMDEPCSALDPIATRRVEELMIELKEKYTIALVTHNMQQAMRVADTTAFFGVDISQGSRTGYLVEMGPTKKIFEEPEQELTRQYVRGEFS